VEAYVPGDNDAEVRHARGHELELVAELDCGTFGGDLEESRAWVRPQLGQPGFRHWIAQARGRPVGLATTVFSDGDAGPTVYLTGVGSSHASVLDALVATAVAAAFCARSPARACKSG
jgi:hypothetical protein